MSLFGTGRVPIEEISCTPVTCGEGEAIYVRAVVTTELEQ